MNDAQRLDQPPLRKAVAIAWKNIRIRWWRSLLVTSGIVLAIAFLAYILASDCLARWAAEHGSTALLEALRRAGALTELSPADARIQTRWMVALAMLISFVGILNAMVMSVTERFREIGTMKCLGAMNGLIVRLFLLESLFQGLLGTVVGLAIGLALAFTEGWFAYGGELWHLTQPLALLGYMLLCLIAGLGLTVAGALYPALCAARMQPVEAMRMEV